MAENPFAHFTIAPTPTREINNPGRWELATLAALCVAMVVSPLLIIPNLENFLLSTKNLALFVTALIVTSLFVAKAIQTKRFQLALTNVTVPLLAFLVVTIISIFFTAPYPVENMLGNGGLLMSSLLIVLLGSSVLPRIDKNWFWMAIAATGSLVGGLSILQAVGLGASKVLTAMTPYTVPHTLDFSITGSSFIALQIVIVSVVALAARWWQQRRAEWWMIASLGISAIAAAVLGFAILPGKSSAPLLMPLAANWSLALDTLRSPRTALIGVGPENFGDAYQIFKPVWMNQNPAWNVIFSQGSNMPLTLLVSSGLLGLAAWLWMVVVSVKSWTKSSDATKAVGTTFLATVALQLLFPFNSVMLLIQAVLFAYWLALYHHSRLEFQAMSAKVVNHRTPRESKEVAGAGLQKVGRVIFAGVSIVVIGGASYLLGRATLASHYIYKAAVATQKNDAVGVYTSQQRAIALNPYIESYRQGYGVTNIQIASALANKTDLTDQEKEEISQLIQQAIREARAATVLSPSNAQSWRILAEFYRNLIGSAQDAEQWSVNAYVQAIQLSPVDPVLRNQLGAIFFSQEQYSQALSLFQQAAELKPDFPNSFYNAANALVKLNQYDQAQAAYERALALLEPDSEAYVQANKELEALQELKKQASESAMTKKPATTPSTPQEQGSSLLDQAISETDSDVVTPVETSLPLNPVSSPTTSNSPAPSPSPAVTGSDL